MVYLMSGTRQGFPKRIVMAYVSCRAETRTASAFGSTTCMVVLP